MLKDAKIEAKRSRQSSKWLWNWLEQQLMMQARQKVKRDAEAFIPDLAQGYISPRAAAHRLLDQFLKQS